MNIPSILEWLDRFVCREPFLPNTKEFSRPFAWSRWWFATDTCMMVWVPIPRKMRDHQEIQRRSFKAAFQQLWTPWPIGRTATHSVSAFGFSGCAAMGS